MKKNGIPIVPGTEKLNDESMDAIKEHARRIGYPVILKASGGGGGRGIREVWQEEDMQDALSHAPERLRRILTTTKFLWRSLSSILAT